ncbi:dek1-calpain-like protein [Stylonychia lemnae]|uniref:Dek1-calpain-like protein n=1 Tax=Stylonychia lemnae TaxID=5949 RepID=A0A077ZRQ4_STYLE|nr:dek1-calpain-like protein [Stylonychia lemnae]|eukprot:CDW72149.1 dek1-calpain-like protein [Stylonychia lemnae]
MSNQTLNQTTSKFVNDDEQYIKSNRKYKLYKCYLDHQQYHNLKYNIKPYLNFNSKVDNWYGHNWHLTKATKVYLIMAGVFAIIYCLIIIFLPDYFSYNGTTAILLTLNYMSVSFLTYSKDEKKYLEIETFIDEMTKEYDIHYTNNNQVIDYVFKKTLETNQIKNKKLKIFAVIAYFFTLGIYALVIIIFGASTYRLVGVINVILVINTDFIIAFTENYRKLFIEKEKFKSLFYFITRLMCCFFVDYWLSMQSIIFFLISILMAISLVDKLQYRNKKVDLANQDVTFLYELSQDLKDYVTTEINELRLDYPDVFSIQKNIFQQFLSEFLYAGYFFIFVIITIISSKNVKGINLFNLDDDQKIGQWVISILSILFSIQFGLIYAWFQYYKENQYKLSIKLGISLAIIESESIILGIIFYAIVQVKIQLIWTSFIMIPLLNSNSPLQDPNQNNNPEQNQIQKNIGKKLILDFNNEKFFSQLWDILSCQQKPQTTHDKFILSMTLANIIINIIFMIITSSSYSPKWVGFTIGVWIFIVELAIIIFIKFYQTYYQATFIIQISAFFAIALYISWIVVMAFVLIINYRKNTLVMVVYFLGVFGSVYFFLYGLATFKYWKLQDKTKITSGIKIIYIISYCLIAAFGIVLIIFKYGEVWGHLMVGSTLFLILKLYFPLVKRQAENNQQFQTQYVKNKDRQSSTILLYSQTLFPTLKFDFNVKKMKKSNKELIYFMISALIFFTWSFLAGILLRVQDRYIGISCTALTLLVTFAYRLMKSNLLERERYKLANVEFFRSSLAFALKLKTQWRNICMNKKSLQDDEQLIILQDTEQIRPQLVQHIQWEYYFYQKTQQIEDTFFSYLFFSTKVYKNTVDMEDERFGLLDIEFDNSDTEEKKVDMRLKLKNLLTTQDNMVQNLINVFKQEFPADESIQALNMKNFYVYLKDSAKRDQFEAFLKKYLEINQKIKRKKTEQLVDDEEQDKDRRDGVNNISHSDSDSDYQKEIDKSQFKDDNNVIGKEDIDNKYKQDDDAIQQNDIKLILDKIEEEFEERLKLIQEQEERERIQQMIEIQRREEEDAANRVRNRMMEIQEQIEIERRIFIEQQERLKIEEQMRYFEEQERIQRQQQEEEQRIRRQQIKEQMENEEQERQWRIREEKERQRKEEQERINRETEQQIRLKQEEEKRQFEIEQERKRQEQKFKLQEEERRRVKEELERKKREFEDQKERRRQDQIRKMEEQRKQMLEEQQRKKEEFERRRKEREQKRKEQLDQEEKKKDEERKQRQRDWLKEEQERKHREDQRKRQQEEDKRKQEEEHRRRQEQYREEQERRAEQERLIRLLKQEEEERQRQEMIKNNINRREEDDDEKQFQFEREDNKNDVSFDLRNQGQDEVQLLNDGNKIYQLHQNKQIFTDPEFDKRKALGKDTHKYQWTRVKDIDLDFQNDAMQRGNANRQQSKTCVFDDGVSACDILQGGLGDCYLLSAMSVIAHTQPKLMRKLFHPKSQIYQENGLYVLMFYRNRQPVIITIDDYFPTQNVRYSFQFLQNKHAYVRISNKEGNKEIWAMLIEKAYAKMYGSYPNIEGGLVDAAFADLTNGAPDRYDLKDQSVKRMNTTGQFWEKLKQWNSKNYLMGAGSPQGSDADISRLGIVQGHAYSILDVFEVEGIKLLQLRNPWGDRTEWKGAWGDSSKEWTERRKRIIYDRMMQRGVQQSDVGENDGIFWMSLSDFFTNFDQLFLCRFFDDSWTEITYRSEWSTRLGTAGGCTNNPTVGQNPQLKLLVEAQGQVEIFMFLQMESKFGAQVDRYGIGFEVYDYQGKKITTNRGLPKPILENSGGYQVARDVSLDTKINGKNVPYTLIMTTYDKNQNAKFTFTLWFKHGQGKVTISEF